MARVELIIDCSLLTSTPDRLRNGSNVEPAVILDQINFGDVDAKNEILKQSRSGERLFFDSYSIPDSVKISEFVTGRKYFILGLKGTGKTALLRYISDLVEKESNLSELILFKSHISEEDRQNLSSGAGFEIISTEDASAFIQDFKEAWKWMIYQRLASLLKSAEYSCDAATAFFKVTGVAERTVFTTFGSLLSRIRSGSVRLSGDALGIAAELGVQIETATENKSASISDLNRTCHALLRRINLSGPVYLFFDELELFHQTTEQFDRDRRIIRDLIYTISHLNAESAEAGLKVYLISALRTEVLHSVLELGHEIGRDVDDFGVSLDWSGGRDAPDHPLLTLIGKKISASTSTPLEEVWAKFFPRKINNQVYYKYILNSSYYRPRDIVRLLRVAREYRKTTEKFTTEHFDRTSTEYSKQTWLEITEELLASYSAREIESLQRFFLGFTTHFFQQDILERVESRYRHDNEIQSLFGNHKLQKILSDLYRIGVVGNDFVVTNNRGRRNRRNRWIFRGNTMLNDAERMSFHKSLWKHLSLVSH